MYHQIVYPVTVNYDLSVEAAIRAGHYHERSAYINSVNFPSTRWGVADLDIILVHYDHDVDSSEQVLEDFDRRDNRAAELPEFLAFGEKYPNAQCEILTVALGSVWLDLTNDTRYVPYVPWGVWWRHLALGHFDYPWPSDSWFAAVPKSA